MKFGDIVARIDDHDCQSIEGFKGDINGKSNFTITVARCKGVNVEDIRSNHAQCVILKHTAPICSAPSRNFLFVLYFQPNPKEKS